MSKNKNKSYVEIVKEDVDQNIKLEPFWADTHKMSLIETVKIDYGSEPDKKYDVVIVTKTIIDAKGSIDYILKTTDNGADGTIDVNRLDDYTYDLKGNPTQQYIGYDGNNDGIYEFQTFRTNQFDSKNRLVKQTDNSPDDSEDGLPDSSYVTEFKYDDKDRLVWQEKRGFFDGGEDPTNYRLDTWKYGTSGVTNNKLLEHVVDDWGSFDDPIYRKYEYNSKGQLTKVLVQDEIGYGQLGYFTDEIFRYDSEGRVAEHIDYQWRGVEGTRFTYNSKGQVIKEIVGEYDEAGTFTAEKMVEYWYGLKGPGKGQVTDILTSFDTNHDGKYDPGTRTKEKFVYHRDGSLAMHTVDENTGADNGWIEEIYTYDVLVA